MIYQLETIKAKSNNKMSSRNIKWANKSTIMCNSVLLLYVYVRKTYLQRKKDDDERGVCVCMSEFCMSVSERNKVVSESSV